MRHHGVVLMRYHLERLDFGAGLDASNAWLSSMASEGWEVVSMVPASFNVNTSPKKGFTSVAGGSAFGTQDITAVMVLLRHG